jgi:isobutyryl-CoA mutase
LTRYFLADFPDKTVAVIAIDPSKRKTGGALLGDRIRMNAVCQSPQAFMRSFATREANVAISKTIRPSVDLLKAAGFDLIIVETAGIGQSNSEIADVADITLYVMTPEYGAASQLEKIDMIDFADFITLNKFDKRGSADALRDIRKQYLRTHKDQKLAPEDTPVFPTISTRFGNSGIIKLYRALIQKISEKKGVARQSSIKVIKDDNAEVRIIPDNRVHYLLEVCDTIDTYEKYVQQQSEIARRLFQLQGARAELQQRKLDASAIDQAYDDLSKCLDSQCHQILKEWENKKTRYRQDVSTYSVRGSEIEVSNFHETISHTKVPKVALPHFQDWGEIVRWSLSENVPGEFPYAAGVYPFKRTQENPTRMFAGEGGPEKTNRRFHYLSEGMPGIRLSTAFDSVTLYGEDPDERPDIYGKIGNSGVNVATLDDAKKLYAGFDLCAPNTSVSMTINGPAPMLLGFFLNAAIDQQCEKYIQANNLTAGVVKKIGQILRSKNSVAPEYHGTLAPGKQPLGLFLLGVTGDEVLPLDVYEKIKLETLTKVRGTVQADILKEDQAQNTCTFSTEFALRMMGDIQEYFIRNNVRNFYSVSISGYHIAEAGANPITQLAFTLANGFTYIEYYLGRGMDINQFVPNFSFFFSNGEDAEYSVIGRVARRIWAKALKLKYHASDRAQMLKYHIQTSGRSLHSQEIAFNDIRTTLQALYSIYDNCNSLHTNAYDEAITTPTEESVRRALAIQLIINHELGLAKNENPLQGSFIIEELTDLVEEAVLLEFRRMNDRGGVLGAMETMYQRGKIQEESLYYESLKHSGKLPIVGVNAFLSKENSPFQAPRKVSRATKDEKDFQIKSLRSFQTRNSQLCSQKMEELKQAARKNQNVFDQLMDVCKVASIGQISRALYEVGGQYRRNM